MNKGKDLHKKLENYRILLIVIIVILLLLMGKSFIKTQNLVGQHLDDITKTIMTGTDLLEQCETEQDQKIVLELIYDAVSDSQEALETVVGKKNNLYAYADKTDELAFHILCMRLEYQDEQLDLVIREMQNISQAISDSEIRKTVTRNGYLYTFDSSGVKEDLDEILAACRQL